MLEDFSFKQDAAFSNINLFYAENTEVPNLCGIWDLNKTALHEICVSGTVGSPLLTRKSPTCVYISQKLR